MMNAKIAHPLDQTIAVVPVEGGWSVICALSQPLMFISGAKAEEKARSLGQVLAKLGHDARVLVHDRSQALVATIRYFAD
jgi:hypothetical protein